jgi:SAM-dependent MidA family methyltransferase
LKNASILAIKAAYSSVAATRRHAGSRATRLYAGLGSKTVAEPRHGNNLVTDTATILRQEVERAGTISLARFMELALYCPESGYYERPADPIGHVGDFFTSVSTGSLFGQMLAFRFAQWVGEARGGSSHLALIEAGAHDGRLAFDILDWLQQHRPKLLSALEYWLIDPSPRRQAWQRARLEQFAGRVRWADSFQALAVDGVNGVIFSNELLDAFPVHRLKWDRASRQWIEWGVGLSKDQFVWSPLPGVEPHGGLALANPNEGHAAIRSVKRDWNAELVQAGFHVGPELKEVLPDGFVIDHCPSARTWWRQAAAALRQGRLLTIDFGFSAEQFLSPERSQGTLRGYRHHRIISDVLANPGEQDLTSHVNFTQLQKAGEDAGLQTDAFLTQAQFLTAIAAKLWSDTGAAPSPTQARQFQTLAHPEHLGRSFRVLIQSRNG